MGAVVSLFGALVTVVLNVLFIPTYGYMASAWATLICYGSMALISYLLGQKYYPVNYDIKKLCGYIFLAIFLWLANSWLTESVPVLAHLWWLTATVFMAVYLAVVWVVDGRVLLVRSGAEMRKKI